MFRYSINGGKCRKGYHIKDTLPDSEPSQVGNSPSGYVNNGANANHNNVNNGGNANHSGGAMNKEGIQDFLSNVIRREMGVIWREMMTPNQPIVKEQTGRDYLWALLGQKLHSSA